MGVDAHSTDHRRHFGGTWEAAAALGAAALVLAARRAGRRSGVSTAELRAPLPGDDLVTQPVWTSTRATNISARPERVWPWIVQMGHPTQRAGWYTPHWLDRLQWGIHARSAERVRPEFQHLEVGDRVADSPDGSAFITVAEIAPCETLVLHSTRHLLGPVRSVSFSWAFHLAPVGKSETRLTIRARVWYEPWWARLIVGPLIGVGDFVNASSMLRGIRRRGGAHRTIAAGRTGKAGAVSTVAAITDYGVSAREWMRMATHHRLDRPADHLGAMLSFRDGTTSRVFRETSVVGATTAGPVLLVIRFRLAFLGDLELLHAGFRHECLIHTPLFRGFRSKLWLEDGDTRIYRGVYQWDGEKDAAAYAARMVGLLAPFSNRGTAEFKLVPGLTRLEFLLDPDVTSGGSSDGWWRLAQRATGDWSS